MKNLLFLCCFFAVFICLAQDKKQAVKEKRARDLHRVMGLNDREQWKKFMTENYSKAMLERPVKTDIETSESSTSSGTSGATADKLEEKLKVFDRLHKNFPNSKIISLKPVSERIEMVVENSDGLRGNFTFEFERDSPFLINRIAVEIK
jgi:hypothetical protein